jgi:hypothetical protein
MATSSQELAKQALQRLKQEMPVSSVKLASSRRGLREQAETTQDVDQKAVAEATQCQVKLTGPLISDKNSEFRRNDGKGFRAVFRVGDKPIDDAGGASAELAVSYSDPVVEEAVKAGKSVLIAERATIASFSTNQPFGFQVTLRGVQNRTPLASGTPTCMVDGGRLGSASNIEVFREPVNETDAATLRKYGPSLFGGREAVELPAVNKFLLSGDSFLLRAANIARDANGDSPITVEATGHLKGHALIDAKEYADRAKEVEAFKTKFFSPLNVAGVAIVVEPVATVDASGKPRDVSSFASPLNNIPAGKDASSVLIQMSLTAVIDCRVVNIQKAAEQPQQQQQQAMGKSAPTRGYEAVDEDDDDED